jgi:hypothetical protein
MSCSWWLVGLLAFLLQVPRPDAGEEVGRELETARRTILARDASELSRLADELAGKGETQAAAEVRARVPRPPKPDGATRFVPLPEIVPPQAASKTGAGKARLEEIRDRSASELFELAKRAAGSEPPRYSLASDCLHEVLVRQPDHREARRLLGHAPYERGWAKPYAIQQLKKGYVDHPTFGWVEADWLPHLERGELPSPPSREKVRWLPAADADRLRADWAPPWRIVTEHFEVQTNVPLAEAIGFGRRLEAFHDLFLSLMADILGDTIPMVRRFHEPALVGEPATKRHVIYYFASKKGFAEYLTPKYGADIADSLGFYDPPKSSRTGRTPAYFYYYPDGQLPVEANLYHEVSHQLLFETAGRNAYTSNFGNYWVFEGLGTYFETVQPQPDGSLEVGGRVGPRIAVAIQSLVDQEKAIPLAQFVALDENGFMRKDRERALRYQQAEALTVFLMQWHQGTYREGFLDYVRDAYRGRIKRGTGRRLEDRLGQPYATLEAQFLAFLRDGRSRDGELSPAPTAATRTTSGGSIRTVPKAEPSAKAAASGSIRTIPRPR